MHARYPNVFHEIRALLLFSLIAVPLRTYIVLSESILTRNRVNTGEISLGLTILRNIFGLARTQISIEHEMEWSLGLLLA